MEGSEPTEAKLAQDRTTSQGGFMAAGTGLFEWEQRIFGRSAEQARKVPEEAPVEVADEVEPEAEVEAEAEAELDSNSEEEELGFEAPPAVRAFWPRRKQQPTE
jgi:hypothetical protein